MPEANDFATRAVGDDLVVVDLPEQQAHTLSGPAVASWSRLCTDVDRRRFLQASLMVGGAGVAMISLPSAAAAASPGSGGDAGAGTYPAAVVALGPLAYCGLDDLGVNRGRQLRQQQRRDVHRRPVVRRLRSDVGR